MPLLISAEIGTVNELLRTVFSSSGSECGSDEGSEEEPTPQLLTIPAVDGLALHKRFLTEEEQASGHPL